MRIITANSVRVNLTFSYIAYLCLYGSFFCIGWAVLLLNIIPFPLIPFLFYFLYQQSKLAYHALLSQQGMYNFVNKESDDDRDWIVSHSLWVSRSLIIIKCHNLYDHRTMYLLKDSCRSSFFNELSIMMRYR
ncbi:protein YgfX [Aliivibrio salmonicida]|uniref:protein YgfX n=1 Tax=Aliivibrio salmonicida TaxID=40269 RepID=UPI003D0A84E9